MVVKLMVATIIKTAIKVAWFNTSYVLIIGNMLGILPTFLSALPAVDTSLVITSIIGGVIGTLNWLFTPGIVKMAMYLWLAVPFIKLGMYISYKVTHI